MRTIDRGARRAAAAATAVGVAVALWAHAAGACTCAPEARIQMIERASDVFVARAVEGPTPVPAAAAGAAPGAVGQTAAGGTSPAKVTFKLEVSETLKGTAQGRVDVRTPADEAACGFKFEVGQTYLVFAERGAHGLHTDLCQGNAWGAGVAGAAEAVRRLVGPPKVRAAAPAPAAPPAP